MFEVLIKEAKLRNFSLRTIDTYIYYNQHFLKFCHKKPTEITTQDIREYLLHLTERRYSSSSINLAHNAINFYYQQIMKRSFPVSFQRREQKMREILTQEEIKALIDMTQNQKHKLLISFLYATGVRVAEVIKIKISDINFPQKLLLVRQGKGKNDRYTILSEKLIIQINEYCRNQRFQSGQFFLFETAKGHITSRTVQLILKNAQKKAKITKSVTPHVLRHSFATHLMEANVKTEYIQQLLGHNDIRTTRIYETIITKHLQVIKSPHDSL